MTWLSFCPQWGKYTDELITMARDVNEKPPKREMDMLFTIGEQMSVALMAMAMDKLGVPAVSLNAFQVSMHTTSSHGNARFKKELIQSVSEGSWTAKRL